MSNDFLSIMSSHSDDCALVYAEGASRAKVIARLKACKTDAEKDASRVWLWGARMIQYVIANVKGASSRNALGMVAAEKAKSLAERADWYKAGDNAARNYMFNARKEAGIEASDKRGGKRDGAGAKAHAKADPVAEKMAAKPETVKPAKLPVISNDKMTREAWFALVNDTLAALEGVGHKIEDVAAAEIKLLTDARARLAGRAKAGK